MAKWIASVVGMLMSVVSIGLGIVMQWHFICDEMTQGAFLKKYWCETLVSIVLLVVGVGLVMRSQDRGAR